MAPFYNLRCRQNKEERRKYENIALKVRRRQPLAKNLRA
jgi:hypothetical protein